MPEDLCAWRPPSASGRRPRLPICVLLILRPRRPCIATPSTLKVRNTSSMALANLRKLKYSANGQRRATQRISPSPLPPHTNRCGSRVEPVCWASSPDTSASAESPLSLVRAKSHEDNHCLQLRRRHVFGRIPFLSDHSSLSRDTAPFPRHRPVPSPLKPQPSSPRAQE